MIRLLSDRTCHSLTTNESGWRIKTASMWTLAGSVGKRWPWRITGAVQGKSSSSAGSPLKALPVCRSSGLQYSYFFSCNKCCFPERFISILNGPLFTILSAIWIKSCVSVCVCVYLFIKLHITAQSGLVILVILRHSRWSSQGGINDTCYENLWSNATEGTHSLYLYKSYLSPEHLVLPPLLPCVCVCVYFLHCT